MLTIAVIDDSLNWMIKIENIIKSASDYSVITKANNGIEFLKWCHHNTQLPDIAIVDVEMPKMDGVQLTDFLSAEFPAIKVIGISSHTHREAIEDMIGCGAYGYVSKLFNISNLTSAISKVANGNIYIDPILKQDDIDRNKLFIERKKQKNSNQLSELNDKDKKLIALYNTSASQKEIADILCISENTLEKQIKKVSEKLNVKERQSFTLKSISKGLVRVARMFSYDK
jgi:DNA-binding NarL/FixJ family response regulator